MTPRRILGMTLLVIGLVLLGFSQYIQGRVAEGRIEIASGQSRVNQSKALFSATPATKDLGQTFFTDPAERRIAAGEAEANRYAALAKQLQIGGVVLSILGIVLILLPPARRN